MHTLILPALNLAILVGVLVYFTRAPFRAFVTGRHETLREEVQRVSTQLRDSQARFEEFTAKLKAIDAEVAALREQSRQDAEAMKARLLNDARRLSTVIVADARTSAESLYEELRIRLRSDLGQQIIDRAEQLLRERLTGDDRVRIRREFSKQVESVQ